MSAGRTLLPFGASWPRRSALREKAHREAVRSVAHLKKNNLRSIKIARVVMAGLPRLAAK
jgi:hypothetical protein